MLILSLDTSTRAGSVSITDEERVLVVHAGDPTRTHGERLPGEIDAALAVAGVNRSQIDLLVVASGPGAFTGLRIGLAAMQGIAMTLGKPIVGVSALDALAWTAMSSETIRTATANTCVAAWMDAQRGEVFSAVYRVGTAEKWPLDPEAQPVVGTPEALLGNGVFDRRRPTIFVGDGARRYAEPIAAGSARWIISAEDLPLAPAVASIGRRLQAQGHATMPHALQPLYVRRPDAEIERDRRARRPADETGQRGSGRSNAKGRPPSS